MKRPQVCSAFPGKIIGFLFIATALVFAYAGSVSAQDEGWQIIRADYGFENQRVDVTKLVVDLIARGGINGRVPVNNQTMGGDPAVGKNKTLRLFARNKRNEEQEFHVNEGDSFAARSFAPLAALRDDHDRADDPSRGDFRGYHNGADDHAREGLGDERHDFRDHGDRNDWHQLSIVRAFYGVQGRSANVTDRVQGMVHDGRLTMPVNNGSMGGDPAIGADKMLIVVYSIDGQEQATVVHEGLLLSLP